MTINKHKNEGILEVGVEGRLDTTTAPELEAALKAELKDADGLVLDLAGLEYISSAGLRVLLSCQKTMNKQGEMIIRNANETVMEIFEVTGFADILHHGNLKIKVNAA